MTAVVAVDTRSSDTSPATAGETLNPPSAGPLGNRRKRAMDLAVAVTALAFLSPLIILVALLVKAQMGGPVVFGHTRVGLGGRSFRCLKFRTMVVNSDEVLQRHLEQNPDAAAEWAATRKLRDDPRVTTFGRVLRQTSLDELPQFVNVLRGEMSCVGPRPVVAEELERYGAHAGEYLKAAPGITGLWQVSGRNSVSYADRVALDCEYVRDWSLRRDMIILLRTIPAVAQVRKAS
jgi:exopolysaccharide production protein ExoY